MMREWATVVSWQDGIATLHSEMKTSCNSCSARKGCGSHMLNKLGPKNAHVMKIASAEPLTPGQRIEVGIEEKSLLSSAVLIYMTPLFGLFLCSGLFQMMFQSDLAAALGAALGGMGGFIVAKGISALLSKSTSFQPVILSVSLPPDVIQIRS